ncbi:MAG TPA: hypothetical protein VJJ21_02150 [Candidatus Nanoarchaeia archaeon]|nr:hypothetical protein [Candidatus Nanoarchaeia archaeon]
MGEQSPFQRDFAELRRLAGLHNRSFGVVFRTYMDARLEFDKGRSLESDLRETTIDFTNRDRERREYQFRVVREYLEGGRLIRG